MLKTNLVPLTFPSYTSAPSNILPWGDSPPTPSNQVGQSRYLTWRSWGLAWFRIQKQIWGRWVQNCGTIPRLSCRLEQSVLARTRMPDISNILCLLSERRVIWENVRNHQQHRARYCLNSILLYVVGGYVRSPKSLDVLKEDKEYC